jgi:hypothetical protein
VNQWGLFARSLEWVLTIGLLTFYVLMVFLAGGAWWIWLFFILPWLMPLTAYSINWTLESAFGPRRSPVELPLEVRQHLLNE